MVYIYSLKSISLKLVNDIFVCSKNSKDSNIDRIASHLIRDNYDLIDMHCKCNAFTTKIERIGFASYIADFKRVKHPWKTHCFTNTFRQNLLKFDC